MSEDFKSVSITLDLDYDIYKFYEEYGRKLKLSAEELIGLFIVETCKKMKKKNKKKFRI